jgi:hypothetical protein
MRMKNIVFILQAVCQQRVFEMDMKYNISFTLNLSFCFKIYVLP